MKENSVSRSALRFLFLLSLQFLFLSLPLALPSLPSLSLRGIPLNVLARSFSFSFFCSLYHFPFIVMILFRATSDCKFYCPEYVEYRGILKLILVSNSSFMTEYLMCIMKKNIILIICNVNCTMNILIMMCKRYVARFN